jgi:sulfur-oxidizing protein SoxY
MDHSVSDRRAFLLGASAVAAILPFLATPGAAQEAAPTWEEALKRLLGDAQPITNGKLLTLELPEIAENGNMVPVTVSVESPMTEAAHVKAVHLIATANPQPSVVSFYFTLLSGRAAASTRMRLARTQDVVALAELSDGKFIMAKRPVKVTIGGCGG